ncbi:MAG: hypothetical protein R3F61_11840 [Myxococcota bacterium]
MLVLAALAGCIQAYEPDDAVPLVPEDHPCADEAPGPWAGHPLSGHDLRTSAYTHDGGIAALFDQLPAQGSTLSVSVPLGGVVAVNRGFEGEPGGAPLWLADAGGGARTFAVSGLDGVDVGDAVSLTVTEITNYFGELEITGISDLGVVSADNAVHVFSAASEPVRFPDDRGSNAEYIGLVTGESPDDCGDNPCIEVDNGTTVQTLDLRGPWPGELIYGETCLHVIAPVEYTRGDARIAASNFDWIRTW